MKKITSLVTVIAINLIGLYQYATAQVASHLTGYNSEMPSLYAQMNDTSEKPDITSNKYTNNIRINAIRNFKKNFYDATNVLWRVTDFGGSVAEFRLDSIHHIVTYNKEGDWLYTVKKYNERQMSQEIRTVVKRIYFDYTILMIDEIDSPQNEKTVFLIYLQDEKSLKTIRVYEGEMELVSDLERG